MSMASLPRSPTSQRSCQAPQGSQDTREGTLGEADEERVRARTHTGIPSLLLGVWGR